MKSGNQSLPVRVACAVALIAVATNSWIPFAHAFQLNSGGKTGLGLSTFFVPGDRRLGRTFLMDTPPDAAYAVREHDVSGHKLIIDAKTCSRIKEETPKLGSPKLDLDPASLEIVPRCDSLISDEYNNVCLMDDRSKARTKYPFVSMIRNSAPYIANHRGELAVLHIPGELLAWDGFTDLMDDIALCWLLGMKIVIVAGCRHQVDSRLEKKFNFDKKKRGHIRITDVDHLRVIEEEAGFVRFEVERQLNRCLRLHGGGDTASHEPGRPPAPNGNVVSGNFFSASPFGVIDGVDYKCTGRPKHLNVRRIVDLLQEGDIVLLTPIGVGPTGEGMNVNSESLAAFVAASLCANKVVYCSNQGMILRNKNTKKALQNFRVRDSLAMLEYFQLEVRKNCFLTFGNTKDFTTEAGDMLIKIGWATRALQDGVDRAHIISPTNGALIEELFTAKQGSGTCISHDSYQSVHPDDDSGDMDPANRDYRQEFVDAMNFDHEPDWPRHAVQRDFPWKNND